MSDHFYLPFPPFFPPSPPASRLIQARFEDLNMDYFRKCMEPVEKVLRDAKIAKSQVRQTDGWPEGGRGREREGGEKEG